MQRREFDHPGGGDRPGGTGGQAGAAVPASPPRSRCGRQRQREQHLGEEDVRPRLAGDQAGVLAREADAGALGDRSVDRPAVVDEAVGAQIAGALAQPGDEAVAGGGEMVVVVDGAAPRAAQTGVGGDPAAGTSGRRRRGVWPRGGGVGPGEGEQRPSPGMAAAEIGGGLDPLRGVPGHSRHPSLVDGPQGAGADPAEGPHRGDPGAAEAPRPGLVEEPVTEGCGVHAGIVLARPFPQPRPPDVENGEGDVENMWLKVADG